MNYPLSQELEETQDDGFLPLHPHKLSKRSSDATCLSERRPPSQDLPCRPGLVQPDQPDSTPLSQESVLPRTQKTPTKFNFVFDMPQSRGASEGDDPVPSHLVDGWSREIVSRKSLGDDDDVPMGSSSRNFPSFVPSPPPPVDILAEETQPEDPLGRSSTWFTRRTTPHRSLAPPTPISMRIKASASHHCCSKPRSVSQPSEKTRNLESFPLNSYNRLSQVDAQRLTPPPTEPQRRLPLSDITCGTSSICHPAAQIFEEPNRHGSSLSCNPLTPLEEQRRRLVEVGEQGYIRRDSLSLPSSACSVSCATFWNHFGASHKRIRAEADENDRRRLFAAPESVRMERRLLFSPILGKGQSGQIESLSPYGTSSDEEYISDSDSLTSFPTDAKDDQNSDLLCQFGELSKRRQSRQHQVLSAFLGQEQPLLEDQSQEGLKKYSFHIFSSSLAEGSGSQRSEVGSSNGDDSILTQELERRSRELFGFAEFSSSSGEG